MVYICGSGRRRRWKRQSSGLNLKHGAYPFRWRVRFPTKNLSLIHDFFRTPYNRLNPADFGSSLVQQIKVLGPHGG